MSKWSSLKLQDFLSSHPQMRLVEFCDEQIIVEGDFSLNAQMDGYQAIHGTHKIRITFPPQYPRILPKVVQLDNRIPKHIDYHIYPDGSFCLGSDIKLKSILHDHLTALDLVEKVVTPFLYKIVHKLKYGIAPCGELDHGEAGLIDDYQRLFKVRNKSCVLQVLSVLGKRKRDANKLLCPCGCGNRLRKCSYRFSLPQWRRLERRRWFRKHLSEFSPMASDKKIIA
jgi:hypothetical protein